MATQVWHRFDRRWVRLLAGAIVIAALGWGVWTLLDRAPSGQPVVEGGGRIEGTEIIVSAKIPGRIIYLQVEEGATVARGEVLARLAAEDVAAQVRQTDAQILAARAQVLQAEAAANAAQQQVHQAATALELARIETAARVAQANAAVDTAATRIPLARSALRATRGQVESAIAQAEAGRAAARAEIRAVEQAVRMAEAELTRAQQDLKRLTALYQEGAVAAAQVDGARAGHEAALAQHHGAEERLQQARSGLAQAEAALVAAYSGREALTQRQQDVAAASSTVREAEAVALQAKAGTLLVALRERDLAAARDQLGRAQALIAAARAQVTAAEAIRARAAAALQDTRVDAPASGTVLRKTANQGEMVAAGMPILTLVDLSSLDLRVYVTGADLGRVKLGQAAEVTLDGVADRIFRGTVIEVAQHAEFTPKTVHMQDERARLVYGVKLRLINPEGALKPGMPANARILVGTETASR